jgi:hypothetical protein
MLLKKQIAFWSYSFNFLTLLNFLYGLSETNRKNIILKSILILKRKLIEYCLSISKVAFKIIIHLQKNSNNIFILNILKNLC